MTREVVLDTNVLVSALISRDGAPSEILDLILSGELNIVFSTKILVEYHTVLQRPKFRFDATQVATLLDFLENTGRFITPQPGQHQLPDRDDESFLDAAQAAGVPLITGNEKHFPQSSRKGTVVVSPRAYVDALRARNIRRMKR